MNSFSALHKSGLLDRDIRHIIEAVETLPEVQCLILFGSRAKGTHKTASDIDLAIKGDAITYTTAVRLAGILDDKPIPYFIDVINYHSISEPALIEHIDRVGILMFEREYAA